MKNHHFSFDGEVWYRPENKPKGMLLAFCDSGTLQLSEDKLEFQGRGLSVSMNGIDEVAITGAPGDFINYWVAVRSGEDVAYFSPARRLALPIFRRKRVQQLYKAIRAATGIREAEQAAT